MAFNIRDVGTRFGAWMMKLVTQAALLLHVLFSLIQVLIETTTLPLRPFHSPPYITITVSAYITSQSTTTYIQGSICEISSAGVAKSEAVGGQGITDFFRLMDFLARSVHASSLAHTLPRNPRCTSIRLRPELSKLAVLFDASV